MKGKKIFSASGRIISGCRKLISRPELAAALLICLSSCGGPALRKEPTSEPDQYHADRDIAMTVASIADAIRVGEPLDTAEYNFEGVMTDGAGRPLYADLRGAPGIWDVDVLSDSKAVMSNVDLGDLLPDDLKSYLASSLELSDDDIVDALRLEEGDEELEMIEYDMRGCRLRIETRKGMSASGIEAPLMRLTISD